MSTLVLLLAGPLQSWGIRSTFDRRDTQPYPTRSGLLGLLASASGIERETPLPSTWSDLRLLVRVDRPGRLLTDFHTVGGDYPQGQEMRTANHQHNKHPMLTYRDYLADAAFTAYLHGPPALIDDLAHATRTPRWPPYLGRRSCPPSLPILVGTSAATPEELATGLPLYRPEPHHTRDLTIAGYRDAHDEESAQADRWPRDVPVSRDPYHRSFTTRPIVEIALTLPAKHCAGVGAPAYRALAEKVHQA